MAKEMYFDDIVRNSLKKGVSKTVQSIRYTYGPRGHNVMIDRGWGGPNITRDGDSVVDEIELDNPYENLAAQLIKESTSKTNDQAGDGTKTTAILTEAIFLEGLKYIAAGANSMAISRGIKKTVAYLVAELKKMSIPVSTNEMIYQIAASASNHDSSIGKIITETMEKITRDGVITIDDGKGIETEVKIVDGMQFDRGYASPYFITDQEHMQVILKDPFILIYEEKLSSAAELIPLLEKIAEAKKSLLIIAEDIESDALSTLVVNKTKGILECAAVKAPGYGDRRKEILEDIAILTGGEAIFKDLGINLKKLKINSLGQAKKVIIDAENTTIIEGVGSDKKIQERIKKLRAQMEKTDSDYDREKLQERIAHFSGGIAQVNIGAATEMEMKEKKNRAESALAAVKAAIEEGVIPGGGTSLLRLSKLLTSAPIDLEGDEKIGLNIICKSLETPFRQLVENSGAEPSVILYKLKNSHDSSWGYDILTGEFKNMVEAGILDPVKVERFALVNASSVAELLLTSDVAITDIKETQSSMPQPGGMGGMPGMGGMGMGGMPGMGGMGMGGMPGGMDMDY
jgi:chaperonin GroEL